MEMQDNDKVVRQCSSEEAQKLHNLHSTPTTPGASFGDYIYFQDYNITNGMTYYYILVDDIAYRLEYQTLTNGKKRFTGNAVELLDDNIEFDDGED
jgi:hypothetical protein